ncbi:hypothetical protein Bca4012_050737 [Brassica carinata]
MNTGDLIFRWVATSKLPGCPNPEPQLSAVHRPIDHHRSSPAATNVRFETNPTSEILISSRPSVAPPSHKSEKPHTAPSSLWWSEETAPEEPSIGASGEGFYEPPGPRASVEIRRVMDLSKSEMKKSERESYTTPERVRSVSSGGMDSSYSAISKNSYLELQKQTHNAKPTSKLLPSDDETFVHDEESFVDDLDLDVSNYPLVNGSKSSQGNGFWDHRKVLILIVMVVFLAPLCALNKIDSLSVTSAASVALAVVFVVVCFAVAAIKLVEGTIDTPRMSPDFGSKKAILDLLVVIPIMSNAYVCHFNVQPIYNELEGRSPHKMNSVGRITTAICVVVYASTAVSGYLLFGQDTESDILTNFDQDLGIRFSSAVNYIVRIGYILHLVLVFPVVHFSLRETVNTLLFEGSPPLSETKKKSLALTAVLLALIYVGSTMIPNIWTAFKFTGATSAVSLGFTFPALIALRLGKQSNALSLVERSVSWLMLILAVVVSVVGTLGNIYSLRSKSD